MIVAAPRWGLSRLDNNAHAVDIDADHPNGVYVTRCGHRLLMVVSLHDEPPERIWMFCARWSDR
ncbi:MAG TPA: hypothetical protein VGL46_14385 [Pseudonocardiaceae bacterium]